MNNSHIPPGVSIIMTTWNRAACIVETIGSIRSQTYANWELIIEDDGSTDDTEALIGQIKDDRIRFYKNGRIAIGGKIKNAGLQKARGEFIAFIDSDDLWAPEKLEKQLGALQQYPGAGFCLTGGFNFIKAGEPVNYFYKKKEGLTVDHVFVNYFRSEVAGFTQALLLRKTCLPVTGLFKEVKSFSDIDFIVNLSFHFKAVILYEPLVYRRLHDSNYITPNWEKSYYEGIELIGDYRKRLPRAVAAHALFRANINFGEKYLLYHKRKKAICRFLKSWQYDPLSLVPLKKIGKAVVQYLRDE